MATIQTQYIDSSDMISSFEKARIIQEITAVLAKDLDGPAQERPILILIGGFQGSGKSTIAQHLQKKHQFTIISTDKIRCKLLERNIIGNLFAEMIGTISKILLLKAVEKSLNIVVDANAHEKRIGEVTQLISPYPAYNILKIFLQTPEAKLIERLESRPKIEGCYQGQIADLKGSLASAKINLSNYDLILMTHTLTLEEEFLSIDSFLARRC
jgi:predicted kinase